MKKILFLIFLTLIVTNHRSMAESYADPKDISKFAISLFTKTCLTQLNSPDNINAFMDKAFPKLDENRKEIFFKLTKASPSATGWFVHVPNKAAMVMILDKEKNACHLISPMGDINSAHDEFKKMYNDAKKNLPQLNVILLEEKNPAPDNGPINSAMDIISPVNTLTTVLSTGNGIKKGAYEIFLTSSIHKTEK